MIHIPLPQVLFNKNVSQQMVRKCVLISSVTQSCLLDYKHSDTLGPHTAAKFDLIYANVSNHDFDIESHVLKPHDTFSYDLIIVDNK